MPPSSRKRPAFSRGRWHVQRERAQIENPAPPPPDQPARALSDGLQAILDALRPNTPGWLTEAAAEWPALVGADVARHTRPGGIDAQGLLVYVDSSVWLAELQRFARSRMLANLQQRFGASRVPALRLSLDPDPPHPRQ